jgi:hypothetical protein
MATVLPSATPRQEVQLQQENVRQQSKIYELERRIAEQDEAIKRLDFSRPVEGGTSSMHLVQAAAHLGQAFTVALRGATHLCSLDRCRCCAKPAPQRPVSPDLAEKSEVRKKQVEEHRKRVTIVPGFRTTSDKVAPGTFGGAMTALEVGGPHLPPLNPVGGLKEHEYVHEDEWWRAGCVINPKERWKENWDMSILFFILYSAIVVPFRICFSAEADGQMWNFEVPHSAPQPRPTPDETCRHRRRRRALRDAEAAARRRRGRSLPWSSALVALALAALSAALAALAALSAALAAPSAALCTGQHYPLARACLI